MTPTRAQMDALLKRDLLSFIQHCFAELNPQARFDDNWHLQVIASKLEAVRRGEIRRLIINLPPRHLKSICASVAFPAWLLGHNPSAEIVCASYGQDLSDSLANDCRSVMTSSWYRRIFPTRFPNQRPAAQDLKTTRGGRRFATSVGGVLTGLGGDIVIIDDPLKPDEAVSDTMRKAVNAWYDNTLYSRLNNKTTGAIIIIMQRLHEDDLVGHVLEQEDWEVVSFPAIAEADEVLEFDTIFGRRQHVRRIGDLLHPAREPQSTLDGIRRIVGAYNFAGQYQQAPAPLGGGMVKREWFRTYADPPAQFVQIVQSWDTANKATELSDHSVCTTWGISGRNAYLLHVLRRRLEYPDLKRAVREQQALHRARVVLIEDKASGTQLIQELVREGMHSVQRYQPTIDKIMRLNAQTGIIENGFVFLPQSAPWLDGYLLELTTFPNARHDDQTDSTSQFLEWFKRGAHQPQVLFGTYGLGRR